MSLDKEQITDPYPKHIAIIMDGNGRWAKKLGKLRIFGHKNGTKAVRTTVETCAKIGIKYLTLYAFSTENWNRPKYEVKTLMENSAVAFPIPEVAPVINTVKFIKNQLIKDTLFS